MATQYLVAVVGETATGKTALALQLARRFNGEIICADSRTVYKGLDISTAKPSVTEQIEIPHHLLDVVEPGEVFTVAEFQKRARKAVADIQSRDRLPFLVGGSGLYVDAVLYNYQFDQTTASRDTQNPRHLDPAVKSSSKELMTGTLIIGLSHSKDTLTKRINDRAEDMLRRGLVQEIKSITQHYDWNTEALQTPAFKAFRPYFAEETSQEEAIVQLKLLDKQLAKRQRTWFKRNPDIHWVSQPEQAFELVQNLLNKKQ